MTKKLPIYQGQSHTLPSITDGNAGLHFTRLYDGYFVAENEKDEKEKEKKKSKAKIQFLSKFAGTIGQNQRAQLEQYASRQYALAQSVGGNTRIYTLDSHFVTGIGYEHPVENGFLWHHTLGVPYLSGSQVKGMMRSMIERYFSGSKEEKRALLKQWFGCNKKSPLDDGYNPTNPDNPAYQASTGELIFFDALPLQPPVMTVDVMTPHMKDWYTKGDKINSMQESDKIPADWHEPKPIPFLAVKEAKFVFSIGKRANSDINLAKVWDVLDKALTYLGTGAKTNTGFGYMKRYIPETEMYKELKKQEKVENWRVEKDPINKAYKQQMDAFINAFRNIWYKKIKNLDKEQIKKEKACIQFLIKVAEFYYSDEMTILRGKREGKVKKNKKDFLQPLLDWEKLL